MKPLAREPDVSVGSIAVALVTATYLESLWIREQIPKLTEFPFTTTNLVAYRKLHKKASPAHALGFKEVDCEVCGLLDEIERLRAVIDDAVGCSETQA